MKMFLRNNVISLFSDKGLVTFVCFFIGISSIYGAQNLTSNFSQTFSASSESAKTAFDDYFDITSICDSEEEEENEEEKLKDDLDEEILDNDSEESTSTLFFVQKQLINWLRFDCLNCNGLTVGSQSNQVPIYIRNCSMKIHS